MKKIELVKNAADCSGCGACAAACPMHAIAMKETADGCKYPSIDETLCSRCEKCVRLCAQRAALSLNAPQQAFAAVGAEAQLVQNSASGGVFASLAKSHLQAGGLAAGAVMDCGDTGLQVYHLLSGSMNDLRRMQGSKYVQSDAWRCYGDVLSALREGKAVLFSGTPCQTAAVRQLSGNPDHLTTIDLVCHGVPPLKMLNDYAEILQKRFAGKLRGINFRDKRCAKSFYAGLEFSGGRGTRSCFLSSRLMSYYRHFLTGAIYRESCYACSYARLERASDLTIGDYWKIEDHHGADFANGNMETRSDWSCVLVNTQKGADFLRRHGEALKLFPTRAEWIAEGNGQLNAPSRKPENREAVLKAYAEGGYAAVEAAFVRQNGGRLRYYWRVIKNMRANRKRRQ